MKNKFIAWMCIAETSRRIEEGEKRLYESLRHHMYCVIVVITKAEQDKDNHGEKFSDIVKRELGILGDGHFQRVLALSIEDDEGNMKAIKGINELTKKTAALLSEGQRQAFIRYEKYKRNLKEMKLMGLLNIMPLVQVLLELY